MWDKASDTVFEQAPAGAHIATLISITDLGTQEGEWKGEKKLQRKVVFTWELPHETREDGKPFIVNKWYTRSLGESANLFKDLTTWLGKAPAIPFDPKSLLGKGCQVVISKNEETGKSKVTTVVSLPKGTKVEAPV